MSNFMSGSHQLTVMYQTDFLAYRRISLWYVLSSRGPVRTFKICQCRVGFGGTCLSGKCQSAGIWNTAKVRSFAPGWSS